MNRTTLYHQHVSLGGKMVDFNGTCLPLRYGKEVEEHLNVRENVGIFDVSHMGEILVEGPDALSLLQQLTPNDLARIGQGSCQYTVFCRKNGTAVDDVIIYNFGRNRYFICVNAANIEKDFRFLEESRFGAVTITDRSASYDQIAVQGPRSLDLLGRLLDLEPATLKPFTFSNTSIDGMPVILSMTGYTGSGGSELYFSPEYSLSIWSKLLDRGEDYHCRPCGLVARDTLRLEMGYMLFGNDLRDDMTPVEAGLDWLIKFNKPDFNGRQIMWDQTNGNLKRKIIGLVMTDNGIPRKGYSVYFDGKKSGEITSGTISPCLKKGIAMALVGSEIELDQEVTVNIRDKYLRAKTVTCPFIQPTRRK